jgi:hypothetical protein
MAELAAHFLGEPIAEARVVPPDRLVAQEPPRRRVRDLSGDNRDQQPAAKRLSA